MNMLSVMFMCNRTRWQWLLCCWKFISGSSLPGLSWPASIWEGGILGLSGVISCSQLGQHPLLLQGWHTHGHLQYHDTKGSPHKATLHRSERHGLLSEPWSLLCPLFFADDPQWYPALSFCLRCLPLWVFSRYVSSEKKKNPSNMLPKCFLARKYITHNFLQVNCKNKGISCYNNTVSVNMPRMEDVLCVICFLYSVTAVVTLLIEPVKLPVNTTDPKTRLFGPVAPDVDCVKPTYRNISFTMLQLFKFTIGMGDMEFTEDYKYKEVFYVLLIGYIILTYILLLNMLIALMNRTVEKTATESTSIWKLQVRWPGGSSVVQGAPIQGSCEFDDVLWLFFQRAITILDMEKRLPCCLKKKLRCGVQKNLCTALGKDTRWCFRLAGCCCFFF